MTTEDPELAARLAGLEAFCVLLGHALGRMLHPDAVVIVKDQARTYLAARNRTQPQEVAARASAYLEELFATFGGQPKPRA